jgi:hypothetical protein
MHLDRAELPRFYTICPVQLLFDYSINSQAYRVWNYLYHCAYRDELISQELLLKLAGHKPYSKDGTAQWKPASERHLRDLLNELAAGGYLRWMRGEVQLHKRYTVLYGDNPRHDHAARHDDSAPRHDDSAPRHDHAAYPSIDHENQDQKNKGGGANFYNLTDQGIELIRLGFFPGVAVEFQNLPGHQFRAIVSKAKQAGPEHIGAVVGWARARLREGWPEQERSNNHAEDQPGGRTSGGRREREPRIDLEDVPEWLRNGG